MSETGLQLTGIKKSYRRVRVLEDMELAVPEGQFVVLLGPSGCGKSTTLNIIGGLDDADAGEVYLDGKRITDLPPHKRDMGMVFQAYALYPHMTVLENMTFGMRIRRMARAEATRRAREVAELLEIEPLLKRKPAQLSGGQQQRVALGRALVRRPRVLLMDEPLSNLDAALRVRMRSEIHRLHTRFETTTVFVTHDQEEALSLADQIALLSDGRIRQIASPTSVYDKPADLFVAKFVGLPQMNLIEGQLEGGTFRAGPLSVPVAVSSDAPRNVVLGARPEALTLTNEPAGPQTLEGRLLVAETIGPELRFEVETEVGDVTIRQAVHSQPMSIGEGIRVRWPTDALHLFARETGTRIPLEAGLRSS